MLQTELSHLITLVLVLMHYWVTLECRVSNTKYVMVLMSMLKFNTMDLTPNLHGVIISIPKFSTMGLTPILLGVSINALIHYNRSNTKSSWC